MYFIKVVPLNLCRKNVRMSNTLLCANIEHTICFLLANTRHPTFAYWSHRSAALPDRTVFRKNPRKKNDDRRRADRCLPYSVKTGRIELFTDRRYFWKSPRLGGVRRGPMTLTGVSVSSATTSRSFSAEKPFETSDHGRSMGVSAD
jgi:hypothetical protein